MNNEFNNQNMNQLNNKVWHKWKVILTAILIIMILFLTALTIYVVVDKKVNNEDNNKNNNIQGNNNKDNVQEENHFVEKELSCEDGYILKDTNCYKQIDIKDATEVYSCKDGYKLSIDKSKCEKIEITEAQKNYTCNNGYTLNGDKCLGVSTIDATPSYSCTTGGNLENDKCIQTVADIQALAYDYYCYMGTLSGDKCLFSPGPATGRCPAGTIQLNAYTCQRDALKEYYCLRGEKRGSMCYSTVATNADVTYSCQNEYTLSNNKCLKNISVNANIKYVCNNGYSLKNNKCEKIINSEKTINYTCDENYKLDQNICILYDIKEAKYK